MTVNRIRRNQNLLTAAEKQQFVNAVLALKANGTYDQFVQWHHDAMMQATPWGTETPSMNVRNAAHRGPVFLPWHREYLNRYELELRKIDPKVTLPYWDWTADNSASSAIWGPDFMGGDGRTSPLDYRVMTGPFAYDAGNWTLNVNSVTAGLNSGPDLKRQFGVNIASLPAQADVDAALNISTYDSSPWNTSSTPSFRNQLEGWIAAPPGLHNRVHVWVGGSMGPMTSPNDPVFFLHHANVDRLWFQWQRKYFSNNLAGSYFPTGGGPQGHNLNDPMFPWKTTPASVLNPPDQLGYTYDKCFIATAAYRSEVAGPVRSLREFRDNTLLKSRHASGFKELLRLYYGFAPGIAEGMEQSETYRKVVKYMVVWPTVMTIKVIVRMTGPLFKTGLSDAS